MPWKYAAVLAVCLLTAAGRFTVPHREPSWPGTYEAFAHIWVGILLAAWWIKSDRRLLVLVILLTALETVMFFAGRS